MKSPITTHVLDTMRGTPASGLRIVLEFESKTRDWQELARGQAGADGRVTDLLGENTKLRPGVYRLRFETAEYFKSVGVDGFYPYIQVVFELKEPMTHCHVPLMLSPYGYSTYRGS